MTPVKRLIAAVLPALVIMSCSDDPITPDRAPAPLALDRQAVDTTLAVSPGNLIIIYNNLTPLDSDTTVEYVWEVTHSSTIGGQWTWSICDPQQCGTINGMRSEFRFIHGIPGFFYVDWHNRSTTPSEISPGTCTLNVRIFPKDGGDTIYYATLMRVRRAALALERTTLDTTIMVTPGATVNLSNTLTAGESGTDIEYVWEVYRTHAVTDSWTWSICDPLACSAPGTTRSEFSFPDGEGGAFEIRWQNNDTQADALVDGPCSLSVRLYPSAGGDTVTCHTVMYVMK